MVRNGTTKALLCFLLVTLFCTQAWQPIASSTSLETPSEVHHAGPATRIVISSPTKTLSKPLQDSCTFTPAAYWVMREFQEAAVAHMLDLEGALRFGNV